jgi:hypothetical protein
MRLRQPRQPPARGAARAWASSRKLASLKTRRRTFAPKLFSVRDA